MVVSDIEDVKISNEDEDVQVKSPYCEKINNSILRELVKLLGWIITKKKYKMYLYTNFRIFLKNQKMSKERSEVGVTTISTSLLLACLCYGNISYLQYISPSLMLH